MDAVRRALLTALLFAVYTLVVTPVGLLSRLVLDPLRRTPDRAARTYWTRPR